MAHATHYLEQVLRLGGAELDLAMALYRDPGLVRAILDAGQLREGPGDVALALVDGPQSPHLIVTRTGAFVTCLSAGMGVKDAVLVPRGKLDAITRQQAVVRERLETARALAEAGSGYPALLRRLQDAGPTLSREEIAALASYEPLLREALPLAVFEHLRVFAQAARRRRGPPGDRFIGALGRAAWTMGHLLVLCGVAVRQSRLVDPMVVRGLVFGAADTFDLPGLFGPFARAVWAVARIGKPALPAAKELWRAADPVAVNAGGLFLTALGLAHQGLRGEVAKALDVGAGGPVARRVRHLVGPLLARTLSEEPPGELFEVFAGVAWKRLGLGGAAPEPGHRDLLAAVVGQEDPLAASVEVLAMMHLTLPPLARARPEDLYLPAALAGKLGGRTDLATREALRLHDEASPPERPARREPTAGRNEPCPCASGKKFKRCCGA